MKYTDTQFGMELLAQLDQGYDPMRIAKWAYTMYLDPDRRGCSQQVLDALIDIFTMEEGEEFHIPEEELRATAERFASSA
jgi:hypothetical protein